jgi:hypothetical protein
LPGIFSIARDACIFYSAPVELESVAFTVEEAGGCQDDDDDPKFLFFGAVGGDNPR